MVGTLEYMAPEVLLKQPGSFASDVYAFGVTLNEAASGVSPFSDCTRDNPKAHTILDMGYGRCAPEIAPSESGCSRACCTLPRTSRVIGMAVHTTGAEVNKQTCLRQKLSSGRSWLRRSWVRACGLCSPQDCHQHLRGFWISAGQRIRTSGPRLRRSQKSCGICRCGASAAA